MFLKNKNIFFLKVKCYVTNNTSTQENLDQGRILQVIILICVNLPFPNKRPFKTTCVNTHYSELKLRFFFPSLLRCNSHTIQFIYFKCIEWFSLQSKLCNDHHNQFSSLPQRNPILISYNPLVSSSIFNHYFMFLQICLF